MGIFDDIFDIPAKLVEKTISLPSDLAKGVKKSIQKTAENIKDIIED